MNVAFANTMKLFYQIVGLPIRLVVYSVLWLVMLMVFAAIRIFDPKAALTAESFMDKTDKDFLLGR